MCLQKQKRQVFEDHDDSLIIIIIITLSKQEEMWNG